jgi:hypothetical protein
MDQRIAHPFLRNLNEFRPRFQQLMPLSASNSLLTSVRAFSLALSDVALPFAATQHVVPAISQVAVFAFDEILFRSASILTPPLDGNFPGC